MEYTIPTMLTIKEAAKRSGLAEYYLRKLVAEGKIVFVKAGKKYLINFEKLAEFLNEGEKEEKIVAVHRGLDPIPVNIAQIIRQAQRR